MPFQSFTKIFHVTPLLPLLFWDGTPRRPFFPHFPPSLNPTSPPTSLKISGPLCPKKKNDKKGDRITRLCEKINVHVAALQKPFFGRILGVLSRGARTNCRRNLHVLIFSLKRFLCRRYFGFELIASCQSSLASSVSKRWPALLFESPTKYFPR